MKVEDVLAKEAEVEERKEIQGLAKKGNVLAEAGEALVKRIPAEESLNSKASRDQSCRTS